MSRYDAFLSYSHADDGAFGPQLQTLLEGFARTGPRRAVRVFRDEQNLAADPDLWGAIERALLESEWFVLLASPAAARSPWVDKEVAWWLEHRDAARLLIARTEPAPDTPLPPVLAGDGAPRPVVVDLTGISRTGRIEARDPQVQRAVAELAGHLHGRPAGDLITADAARRRRNRTLTRGALLALSALLVLAIGFAGLTVTQTRRADAQTAVATAHLLAATALADADTDLERAALLAVEGYRLQPDTQTLTALLRSVDGSGPFGARTTVDDEVIAVAPLLRTAQRSVVLATESGQVLHWDLDGAPVPVMSVGARPKALAASADGSVIAVATAAPAAGVWLHAAGRTRKVQDVEVVDVAVDPSGTRFATVRWLTDEHTLRVHAVPDDLAADDPADDPDDDLVAETDLSGTEFDAVRLQDDAAVLHQRASNRGLGLWQRRSLPGLKVLDEGRVLDGDLADDVGTGVATTQATSQDGRFVLTQLDDAVHAVDTTEGTTYSGPVPSALGTYPMTVMAVSPSGLEVLLARRDEVWTVRLDRYGVTRAERLEGVGTPDAAVFLSETLVLLAHGRTLTTLDVDAVDTLARTTADLGGIPPDRALAPDGSTVVSAGRRPVAGSAGESPLLAMTHAFDGSGEVAPPAVATALSHVRGQLADAAGTRLLPVPLADGTLLFVDGGDGAVYAAADAPASGTDGTGDTDGTEGTEGTDSTDSASGTDPPPLVPQFETRPGEVLDAAVDDEGRLVLAGANGAVQVRDARTGELVHQARAPVGSGVKIRAAKISPDGRLVAFHGVRTADETFRTARVEVLDVATGEARGQDLTAGRLTSRANIRFWQWQVAFAFGDDFLAVAHAGGFAVLDRDGGAVRREIAAPTTGRQNAAAPVPGTTLVALAGDADWIRLFDTTTGDEVGYLTAPAGSVDGESPLWLAAGQETLWAVGPRYLTRWDVRPERLLAQACEFAARDLTADEWRQAGAGDPPDDLACDRPVPGAASTQGRP
ncbi:toll/interleukin-1 receptor domain-containing protein [Promicromonospora sp. NPDC057488]|uniref:toll/interleukin-1 receptor domain-containing protein n=1 Tax=Promicromonospora sp. NPDC057488 TaxID=3346147 RepID=UPI00366C5468